jgi:hypothetical protein
MINNPTGAFRTHQHYLEAFALLATRGQFRLSEAYKDIKANFDNTVNPTNIGQNIKSRDQVRHSLENAWGTELLLLLSHRFLKTDEIVRISNNWNVIQGYYAIYHATQALLIGRGFIRPETHPKTQTMFLDIWGHLPKEYAPWSLTYGYRGCNQSEINVDTSIHAWTSVGKSNCWSIACKALQTTREDALKDRMKQERDEKRKKNRKEWMEKQNIGKTTKREQQKEPRFPLPQLTSKEKLRIFEKIRNYTLLDYFYRLRIHSNYLDSEMFTDGPVEEHESTDVRVSIIRIVSTSIYASELMLCKSQDDRNILKDWATTWSKKNIPKTMPFGVIERIDLWN